MQVDGDGQHPPREIPKLIDPLFKNGFDMAVGSRFLGGAYKVPFMRALGIKIIALFLRLAKGVKVQGRHERVPRARKAGNGVFRGLLSIRVTTEPESLLLARIEEGFKVTEVAVEMSYREHGIVFSFSITPLRAAYYMTKVLLAMLIDLFKKFSETARHAAYPSLHRRHRHHVFSCHLRIHSKETPEGGVRHSTSCTSSIVAVLSLGPV